MFIFTQAYRTVQRNDECVFMIINCEEVCEMDELRKNEELTEVSFDDIETVEEIVTGSVSGFSNCCFG